MSASDSSERYRSIVETAVDAIVTIDERGIIDSVNPATERLFGYAAAEMTGRNVSMLMPEPHASSHDGYLARYLAGGEPRIIGIGREVTARRKDGSTFPMHLAVGQMDVDGRVMFTGVIRDMSDLRAAETEARAQRDYVAAVVESLQDGLLVRELDGAIAQVNARFCEMVGYSAEELVGARPPFPYWPDDTTDPLDAIAAAGGEADLTFRRRDGSDIAVIVAAAPVRDEAGRLLRYVETVKDVTGRRVAEQQLAAERDHAAGILAALRDGLIVLSPEGVVLDVNDTFLELVGLERADVIGIAGPPFPWNAHGGAATEVFARVRASAGGQNELIFRRPSGDEFPVQISTAARHDASGAVVGFVATCRDLGPMRDAEEELRRSEAAQRESEALLVAERDAQRLKDEFLAMVSHELRTPLAAVVGYLELAISDVAEPGVRELLEVAERNGRRLTALVRDILLVSQADAGRLSLDMRPVALGELVSQAVLAARPSAGAKDIRLEDSVGANPTMRADPDRLGQVLDNLISNAIKFSPSGGRVRVTLESGTSWVRITVSDDGPGIAPDDLDRLFEPFYRASRADQVAVPGSGLGLAVVKAIAEAHGGTVGVDTELGRGSAFCAELPLEAAERPFAPVGAAR